MEFHRRNASCNIYILGCDPFTKWSEPPRNLTIFFLQAARILHYDLCLGGIAKLQKPQSVLGKATTTCGPNTCSANLGMFLFTTPYSVLDNRTKNPAHNGSTSHSAHDARGLWYPSSCYQLVYRSVSDLVSTL